MKMPFEYPDPKHPDMSPAAIDQRLREVGQLYRLGVSFRSAKWLGPVSERALRGEPVEECVVTFPASEQNAQEACDTSNN